MADAPRVWVLADPRAGTAAQALGIAERLDLPFLTLPLAWGPLARLPLPWPSLAGLAPPCRAALRAALDRRAPALVISAGRRAAPVARWLKRRSGARLVHAMRPGFGAAEFDLLVIGRHDRPRPAANLLEILGACHRMSPARLAAARAEWATLAALPAPRVALLLGGPVRGEGLDPALVAGLVPRLRARFPGASILASSSRRSGAAATAALAASLKGLPHRLFRWGDAGPNPYAGFLAWADAIVVTGDSVSMLSEACATGAPVLVATREQGRHAALAESLVQAGHAGWLDQDQPIRPGPPLDESARVAEAARKLLDRTGRGSAPSRPSPPQM